MWDKFIDLSASLFDIVVEILKILGLAVLVVLLAGAGVAFFYVLFALGAVLGYVITLVGTVTSGWLAFACIFLAGFIALTDASGQKPLWVAEWVVDAAAFGCLFLGFLWSSATATTSTSLRFQLLLVTVIALFAGLRIRPYYIRWRTSRRAARS